MKFAAGFTEEHYNAVQPHHDAILALVDRTVAEYLDRYSFDDGFPQRDRLSGEYYVGSEHYHQAARFWARIFAINFAVGVVTGIPMEFQFGTNWSTSPVSPGA